MKKIYLLISSVLHPSILYSVVQKEDVVHLFEGNLALRTSQQPAPLFCFGQFLVDKGNIQGFVIPSWLGRKFGTLDAVTPRFIYGLNNEITFLTQLPISISHHKKCSSDSSRIGDLLASIECLWYINDTLTYVDKITTVAHVTFPTGPLINDKIIGLGVSNILSGLRAPTIFLGFTAHRRALDWYYWISSGATYRFPHMRLQKGADFLYQAGVGRNLYAIPQKLIITAMLEFLGTYTARDACCGQKNMMSGSNVFALAPVMWISTMHAIFKAGVAIPVVQQVKYKFNRNNYLAMLAVGCTFN